MPKLIFPLGWWVFSGAAIAAPHEDFSDSGEYCPSYGLDST